jgi:formylglycine-generating enzyme required for sulfatase activity
MDRVSGFGFRVLGLGLIVVAAFGCLSRPSSNVPTRVTLASSPENGANVEIGGISYGSTPVVIEKRMPGTVLVVLTKEGYERAVRMVRLPEKGEERIVIEMAPLLGYVTIESKPAGAKVFLDGDQYVGDTPLVHKAVVVGKHTYELRREDYKPLSAQIEVEADYQYTFAHELTPKEAALSVFTRPTAAKIWLNEEIQRQTTPAKFELDPGEYTVRAYVKGYITGEETVVLKPHDERTIEMSLKPGDAPPGMVLVPAGKFIMGLNGGSPDERPQREVELDAFYIDRCEVTNEAFKAAFPQHTFQKKHEQWPVVEISFQEASEYAQAVGKRLPTEEEWEKAARGADGREYPWGSEFNKDLCNVDGSGIGGVARVGQYKQGVSPYGCLDMAGNAYEWTSSWYQAYPGNTDVTKEYGQVFRVLRGGSYMTDRFHARCARRHYDRMAAKRSDYGFRCAKDVVVGS